MSYIKNYTFFNIILYLSLLHAINLLPMSNLKQSEYAISDFLLSNPKNISLDFYKSIQPKNNTDKQQSRSTHPELTVTRLRRHQEALNHEKRTSLVVPRLPRHQQVLQGQLLDNNEHAKFLLMIRSQNLQKEDFEFLQKYLEKNFTLLEWAIMFHNHTIYDLLRKANANSSNVEQKKLLLLSAHNLNLPIFKKILSQNPELQTLISSDENYMNEILAALLTGDIDYLAQALSNISTIDEVGLRVPSSHLALPYLSNDAKKTNKDLKTIQEKLEDQISNEKKYLESNRLTMFKYLCDKLPDIHTIKNDQEQTVFHIAAQNKLLKIIAFCLNKSGKTIDFSKDEHGYTIFDYAVHNKNIGLINELRNKGYNLKIDSTTLTKILDENCPLSADESASILYNYIKENDVHSRAIVKLLTARNININNKYNYYFDTILLLATSYENIDARIIQDIIDTGADVNQTTTDDNTALMHAAANKHTDIVNILIAANADVNIVNNDNQTALMIAAHNGYTDIVNILIAAKANVNIVNNDNKTALMLAADNGYTGIVKILIAAEANINTVSNNNNTALIYAAQNGYTEIVNILIAANADVNIANNKGNAALIFATQSRYTEIVKTLIAANADVNQRNLLGDTALLFAAHNGYTEIVNILITKNANVNIANNKGGTALMLAAYKGHTDVVNILIAAEANVNTINNDNNTALIFAAENGYAEIVDILIAKNANVNIVNNKGNTALILAINKGHTDIAKALIAANADVNQRNLLGKTALICAAENGYTEIVDILIAAGAIFTQDDSDQDLCNVTIERCYDPTFELNDDD